MATFFMLIGVATVAAGITAALAKLDGRAL